MDAPHPIGPRTADHSGLQPALDALAAGGLPALGDHAVDLRSYIVHLETIRPDELTRDDSLAFWLNLYNAGAMALAVEALESGVSSVLRVPGAFSRSLVTVDDVDLSLDAIEHAKLRRFGDPRIHGALVCGSLSCPTLRQQPYTGEGLEDQLDGQMRVFLSRGGATPGGDDVLELSRVFLWFGGDFVRPHRMPTFLPATKSSILHSLNPWLPDDLRERRRVRFQDYEWGLACAIA